YRSRMPIHFAHVVCDEGHIIKTIKTRAHQSVRSLNTDSVWFLTATPLVNNTRDIFGYLAILY
ncbi:uncharacterized protein BO87DRAFT_280875, partial [Aspergillus neoniger CBS 115656]